PLENAVPRFGVQVAALSDQSSAEALAAKARQETGAEAGVVFDSGGGVYKVIVGDFASAEEATPFRQTLVDKGYAKDSLIVRRPSTQTFQKEIRLVDDEGNEYTFAGESILVLPAQGETIEIADHPYRGGARVFVNSRGLLNVINELNLEDYVRGVIPNEMGPRTYPALEALKAQALAARTYVFKRLGEYSAEGYDICPTPACQVYKGFSTEDPLTDQAVKETEGQVITFDGQPIDALFTSTCGGATSDVSTMFPDRHEPYLKGVPCVELQTTTITGREITPLLTETQTAARIFEAITGAPAAGNSWSASDVATATRAAAKSAGFPIDSSARPASSRRGDVLRYLGRVLHFDDASNVLLLPQDRAYFFPTSSPDADPYPAAAFMIKYRILPSQNIDKVDLDAAMPRDELHAVLYHWMENYGALSEVKGVLATADGRALSLRAGGKTLSYTLPDGIPLFRVINDRAQEQQSVTTMTGDRVTVFADRSGRVGALEVEGNYDGAAFDRTSAYSSWVRSYRADELVPAISRRFPIQKLQDLRPTVVDPAHRVAEMEVTAEGGRVFTMKGIVIRWSLKLPDNLFWMSKTKDSDGVDRYTFFGKGWGHGTGMCQVGAYGMAVRGWTADKIVKWYYTGVEITPVSSLTAANATP
ncbi:MAG: SpoIID/LytB domain-containing protein, partial [Thermoanaerobaculia bacterium]